MTPATLAEVPTPALIVDVAALDRNIARMARFFAEGACRLRPHVKAHKTPAIARRQLAAGSCAGLTCATVLEAEAVAGFCDDLLIANEIVSADKCLRAAALAGSRRVTVAVDSHEGIDALAAAARAAGVTLGVLVDLDVGQMRCGVLPGAPALALAARAAAAPGLELRGVMGYEGHVQPVRDRAERTAQAQRAMAALVGTAAQLRAAGLPCGIVSAGGTGTFDISGRVPGVTEIQAGSYALMDTDYGDVGVPFEQAFFVLGTVVSRPAADRCVADAGHKSATKDHSLPRVHGIDGATVTSLNDEHATIAIPPGSRVRIGDRVRLVPSHTDPTVNLHDAFYAFEGERIVDVWPVSARGYGRA
ncbi:MAG TPA: DSD1 family PLP-dependent enzyme [Vicinamibacterales bacterium]|nr:DSD1 family PLP-dependent enzyme [Vicinamibacterales bacterium]